MTITTIQKITNILAENGELLSSETIESYVITAAPGKVFKNILTGTTQTSKLCVGKWSLIKNYIEVEAPNNP